MVQRFLAQMSIMLQLDHPHIIKLLDFFEERDAYFMVVEKMRGEHSVPFGSMAGTHACPCSSLARLHPRHVHGMHACLEESGAWIARSLNGFYVHASRRSINPESCLSSSPS